jgi:large subunit ribosomal protein L20
MPRVKRGFTKHRRHSQVLRVVKGHRTSRGHLYRTARQEMMRAWNYAYRDRRARKRDMRALWIVRINAAARQHGLPYNRFISGLMRLGITLDRKVLADIAVNQPLAFATLAYQVRGEAMPDEVRARYGAAPVAAPRARRASRRAAPATETAAAPAVVSDVDEVQEQPEAAAPEASEAALTTDEPEATVAEEEAAESGNPPDHAGTEDRPEEGHGDSEQGTSR